MNRTTLCALAAVGTFFRVDMRTVVLNGDCAKFADALTFFTADTAVGAYLSGVRTLFMVHAGLLGRISRMEFGQTFAQALHPMHRSSLTFAMWSTIWIASYSQALVQSP